MYNREKIMNTLGEIRDESGTIAPYVIIAQPRRDLNEQPAQEFNGHGLTHIDLMGYSHGFVDIGGEKVDVARNYLIDRCLEVTEAKYMFFIGEDTVVPWDAFDKLRQTAEANPRSVVTGVYYMKGSNPMIMVRENNIIKIPNIDPGQVIEAWQTGMDCMLIPLDLLREIQAKEPDLPFTCIANELVGFPFVGEDNFFVHRLHKHGIKLLVNTSVQCLHMDLASGKYTAHPNVDLNDYYTSIKPTSRITLKDKKEMDERWISRIPEGTFGPKQNINTLIQEGKPVKFNMGAGRDLFDGYIAVDLNSPTAHIREDITTLELPENCADEILASHILEHILHIKVPELLSKWYKTLKPDGKLVIECPDLEAMAIDFVNGDDNARYIDTIAIFGISANNITDKTLKDGTSSVHLWGYYPKVLSELLRSVGFNNIIQEEPVGQHPGKNFRLVATK